MGIRVFSVKSYNSPGECTEKLDGCQALVANPDSTVPMRFVYYDHAYHLVCLNCLKKRLQSGDWYIQE